MASKFRCGTMGFDISDTGSSGQSHSATRRFTKASAGDRLPDRVRDSRRNYQWEKLSIRFKAHCRTRNALCHICVARGDTEHAVIDYGAKALSPKAFETDHIKPWRQYPEMRYVWGNLAASHSRCNRQRRDDEIPEAVEAQPIWVKPDW